MHQVVETNGCSVVVGYQRLLSPDNPTGENDTRDTVVDSCVFSAII